MPIINKLPIGGGASTELGITDGKGALSLNIFTQQEEPEVKDGIWIKTDNKYEKVIINKKYANYASGAWSDTGDILPIQLGVGHSSNSIIYHDEIHIFDKAHHYKFNGVSWIKLADSKKPYWNSVCVYKDKIYICCENSGIVVWDDESNEYIPMQPNFIKNSYNMVIYNDEIHVITSSIYNNDTSTSWHYSWDGTTWTYHGDYRINRHSVGGFAVVLNGEIHIMGGNGDGGMGGIGSNSSIAKQDYIYNGAEWNASNIPLPVTFYGGIAIIYNNEIHIMGGYYDNIASAENQYKFDGMTWTMFSKLPYRLMWGNVVVWKNDIHMLGGLTDSVTGTTKHYIFQSLEEIYEPNTVIINKGKSNNGSYLTNIANTSSIIEGDDLNNRFPSGFDDCFYFANTAFDWTASMYYGDGTKWIKFKN